MIKISASLLSARENLENTIKEFNNLDIDYIHLDIMDNEFVPYNSFSYEEIKKIIVLSQKPFDVHLMVKNIDEYIYNYAMLNTEYITVHYEALDNLRIIDKIKDYGIKCGISIKPSTNIELIYDLLPKIDMVLVMSVEPGRGGQEFISDTLIKIENLKNKIKKDNLNVIISVDGGINKNRAIECINAGVDNLVIGSSLVNDLDRKAFINKCKENDL